MVGLVYRVIEPTDSTCLETAVNAFTKLFARFEIRYIFTRQLNRITSFGVTSYPGGTIMQAKAAKTANFNAIIVHKRMSHALQDHFDSNFHIPGGKLILLGNDIID